jgi:hypothetical protein
VDGTVFLFPPGMLSLKPHFASSNTSISYMQLWQSVDPDVYHDNNGDRSDITPSAGAVIDAVFALAQAYQLSINDNTGFTGARLRSYVVTKLHDEVAFEGVSGVMDFNIYGDQRYSAFDVLNYQMSATEESTGNWETVGNVIRDDTSGNDFSRKFNYSKIVWPDGSTGYTDSYSTQLDPYCPPGYSSERRGSVLTCVACVVGTYKAYYGAQPCDACPTGADCKRCGDQCAVCAPRILAR